MQACDCVRERQFLKSLCQQLLAKAEYAERQDLVQRCRASLEKLRDEYRQVLLKMYPTSSAGTIVELSDYLAAREQLKATCRRSISAIEDPTSLLEEALKLKADLCALDEQVARTGKSAFVRPCGGLASLEDADIPANVDGDFMFELTPEAFLERCAAFLDRINALLLQGLGSDLAPAISIDRSVYEHPQAAGRFASHHFLHSLGRLLRAIQSIFQHEHSSFGDLVFRDKVRAVVLHSANETVCPGEVSAEFDRGDGVLTITGTFREQDTDDWPSVSQFKECLLRLGIGSDKKHRVPVLQNLASSLPLFEDMLKLKNWNWYSPPESIVLEVLAAESIPQTDYIKAYWNSFKINKRDSKQERGLLLSKKGFYSFASGGKKTKPHPYSEILAIDLHGVDDKEKGALPGELRMTIWQKDPVSKLVQSADKSAAGTVSRLLSGSSMDVPDYDVRLSLDRKARPLRMHPPTAIANGKKVEELHSLTYACDHKSKGKSGSFTVEEGNSIIVEMAYALYAAWRNAEGYQEPPFWVGAPLADNLVKPIMIPDLRPDELLYMS